MVDDQCFSLDWAFVLIDSHRNKLKHEIIRTDGTLLGTIQIFPLVYASIDYKLFIYYKCFFRLTPNFRTQ
ncbi:hypothetical protein DHD05_08055 [Arenibacter sp. N53]|nr:hypothetical protein [Arenibacter sp. N53]